MDESKSGVTNLSIKGEDIDNAPTFDTINGNISSRERTTETVPWSPVPWTIVGEAGPDQRTPNISSIIQEIVNRPGWMNGNALVIIITGTGTRTAEAYDGISTAAPLLHVVFSTTANTAPSVAISEPADGTIFRSGVSIPFTGTASDTEDGDLTTDLSWNSDIDGPIGSGGSFSTTSLSVADHTITASVTDSGGLSGSDQVVIYVRECVGDFDPADGDVDGSDLEQLAAAPNLLNLSDFAVDFGRTNCINP